MSFKRCFLGTPKLVINLFRHGARGPLKTDDLYWKGLEGQLTSTGKAQHYILGASLIQRYPHLKDVLKQPERMFLRTTQFARTKESLHYHLLGMYEAHEHALDSLLIYNTDFALKVKEHLVYKHFLKADMEMIKKFEDKIHTVPFDEDFEMLCTEPKACPNSFKLLGPENEILLENNIKPVCERLWKDMGIKMGSQEFRYYYDYILANQFEGRNLPDRLSNELWAYLKLAGEYYVTFKRFGSDIQKKIFSIFLLEKILDLLHASRKNEASHELILMSAHDVTIFNLLNALNIITPQKLLEKMNKIDLLHAYEFPNFASQVLIELWESEDGKEHFVRIIYENQILNFTQTQEQQFYSLTELEKTFKAFYAPYSKQDFYNHGGIEKYMTKNT